VTYQWRIFLASLEPVCGSEQSGHRPVLVVSNEKVNLVLPVVNIVPLTSRKSETRVIYPNEVLIPRASGGLPRESIALCYQIRTLDKRRLEQEIGEIHDVALMHQIHEAIRFQLDL